ncbi:BrnT family toxin [Glycocaulis sp.]|uniref:BrnT family toxin n=1 Tax=Glycocaulis sp. TaxID=1969725 RepID=UPI00345B73F1|nr:BrnT family toxin [Glycocaulis sp.]
MEFEWDEAKNRANREKHGISFEEAVGLFAGKYVLIPARSGPEGEERWKAVGPLRNRPVIVVVHTDRSGRVRIMSVRPASRKERRRYDGTHSTRET